jgi:metal-responsive CopG/Arc/MetJ family transcriptional regulator
MMRRFTLSISEEMERALDKERKKRMLESIPETARVIISEYLAAQQTVNSEKHWGKGE